MLETTITTKRKFTYGALLKIIEVAISIANKLNKNMVIKINLQV